MKQGSILIVDDNVQILNSLKLLLNDEFRKIDTVRNPNQIPKKLWHESYDIIMLDMNFAIGSTSGNEGLFWMDEIRKSDPFAVIILITAYGDIELAVKAIKLGATDFITKPWDTDKLLLTLRNAYELRKSRKQVKDLENKQKQLTQDIDREFKMFVGSSEVMNGLMSTIHKVAQTDVNVLILGENGTGKELIAREIHKQSERRANIFVGVDVATLSESLFESEMFGHVKGAFTDARDDRAGRFENAHGGTLFLDEIGNLPLSLQPKLLQAIQNREVIRVGSNRPIPIDIRLISATNKPVMQMVADGTFREDLFYRLNTISIEVPTLRDRHEDIPGLAEFFLKEFSRKYDKQNLRLTDKAFDKLTMYPWPGNIRELKHTMEKAVILSDQPRIGPGNLYLTIHQQERYLKSYKLSDVERRTIIEVLDTCGGNYSEAARILDISRTTLYVKLKKYGI
jgi:DNA-binding NtrC family response regulator